MRIMLTPPRASSKTLILDRLEAEYLSRMLALSRCGATRTPSDHRGPRAFLVSVAVRVGYRVAGSGAKLRHIERGRHPRIITANWNITYTLTHSRADSMKP